jgi:hypothetical protein
MQEASSGTLNCVEKKTLSSARFEMVGAGGEFVLTTQAASSGVVSSEQRVRETGSPGHQS